MKVEIQIFIIRLDGKIISYTPIKDCYTEVQITIESKYLTDEDIRDFYRHMNLDAQEDLIKFIRANGSFSTCYEAKDAYNKLSRYSMQIETFELEIN